MSTRHYTHTIGGQGIATGLPVRRGSHLYEHDPEARYPDLLDEGVHPSQHQYTERPYSRLPHLPITFIQEPEIMHPDRPGTGNLTRRQYFVIKLGQPLMAAQNRDRSIGVFIDDGGTASVKDRTYLDPEKLADQATPSGFHDAGRYQLKDSSTNLVNFDSAAPTVIDTSAYDNLSATGSVADTTALGNLSLSDLDTMDEDATIDSDDASSTGADGTKVLVLDAGSGDSYIYTYDQSGGTDVSGGSNLAGTWTKGPSAVNGTEAGKFDYKKVTKSDPVSISRFDALSDEKKEGFQLVYKNTGDTNDEIATGGTDMYASTEKALFGSSDRVEHVRVDANEFYFGNATKRAGFVYPSTGGADRTLFFNQVDREAGVMLPVDGSDTARTVQDIGSVTDVSANNIANYKDSAVHLEAKETIGVSHADLEQATSHKYHHFSTGTDAVQPIKTGELLLPFINITALKSAIQNNTDLTWGGDPANSDSFNFVDQTEAKSGIKTGLYGVTDISDVNKISLLTDRDDGYSNLYYNLAAPFLVTDRVPSIKDGVKPDLFGNYTLADNGALSQNTSTSAWNFSDSQAADNENGSVDMAALGLGSHVIGSVQEVYDDKDQGRVDLTELRVNPIFQNRLTDADADRNLTNEGHNRPGGTADTVGIDQLLADATFMALGGANESWFSGLLPDYQGLGQDVSQILEDLVTSGAVGEVKIAFDATGLR